MKILNYVVCDSFKKNAFVVSIHKQFESGKTLSYKQIEVIEDILEIELDFLDFEFTLPEDHELFDDFTVIRAKLLKNSFRKVKPKNKCIRAIQSIIDGKARLDIIDQIINPEYHYTRY